MESIHMRITSVVSLTILAGVSACAQLPLNEGGQPEDSQPTIFVREKPTEPQKAPPSVTVEPTEQKTPLTPTVFVDPSNTNDIYVAITGPEEIIFDWTTDRCDPQDFPDMPTRAFRNSQGMVITNRSRERNRLSIGPDLEHLEHRCEVALESSNDPDPANFNSHEWFQAFYTEDGQTVHAILHNEHCDDPGQGCLYQNMTYAVSTDGGLTYQQPTPPEHLVATVPYRYDSEFGFYGMVGGSNILRAEDDFYYMAALNISPGSSDRWACMLRTKTLGDPTSWRAWDGVGFNVQFLNPYLNPDMEPAQHQCQPVAPEYGQLASMHGSLTYSTFLKRYVLLDMMDQYFDGHQVWGMYFSMSPDMIHWSERRLILEIPLVPQSGPGGPDAAGYPVFLDPGSLSSNFDRINQDVYLYYSRFNNHGDALPDADLVRFPVSFQVNEEHAEDLDARSQLSFQIMSTTDALELTGNLQRLNGEPIGGVPINFSAEPLESGQIVEYRLREIVPQGFFKAVAGLRMNTECLCEGSGELTVYEFSYREEGGEERVPNGGFQAGLSGYYNVSTGVVEFLPDASGDGPAVHIAVTDATSAAIHSPTFNVIPGKSYEFIVRAKVEPGSERSGHFALIFSKPTGEGARMMIPLEPYREELGTATTGPDGRFQLHIDPPAEPVWIEARFEGSESYWPASVSAEYP